MKNLIIIGAGGFAREIYWHAPECVGFGSDWTVKGFLDGDVKLSAEEYQKLPSEVPLLGDIDSYEIEPDDVFACAIGTPAVRKKLVEKILPRGAEFINVIHRRATVMPRAKLGRGVVICLASGISDLVELGDFVVINNVTYLGHDVKVGEYTCIMSHVEIGGGTVIGNEVFIGSQVAIVPKSKIGDGAFVGIGSVVLRRVKAGAKVFGNPAREV